MRSLVEGDLQSPAAALEGLSLPSMVHHDAAHELRGDRKEMSAILPVRLGFIREGKIGIMDEHGGLQGVAGALLAHVAAGETVQFRLDERDELIERGGVSAAPGDEQLRDLCLCGGSHYPRRI